MVATKYAPAKWKFRKAKVRRRETKSADYVTGPDCCNGIVFRCAMRCSFFHTTCGASSTSQSLTDARLRLRRNVCLKT
ncbi:hypothetical protein NPIL_396332 [Nephila pilipes]|nr:hypothetical protein NPIL_396332 [Nephila pilipes]